MACSAAFKLAQRSRYHLVGPLTHRRQLRCFTWHHHFVQQAGAGVSRLRHCRALTVAMALRNESKEERAARKQAVKAEKAAKRERKQGIIPDDYGQKECSLCQKNVDLLIRRAHQIPSETDSSKQLYSSNKTTYLGAIRGQGNQHQFCNLPAALSCRCSALLMSWQSSRVHAAVTAISDKCVSCLLQVSNL